MTTDKAKQALEQIRAGFEALGFAVRGSDPSREIAVSIDQPQRAGRTDVIGEGGEIRILLRDSATGPKAAILVDADVRVSIEARAR